MGSRLRVALAASELAEDRLPRGHNNLIADPAVTASPIGDPSFLNMLNKLCRYFKETVERENERVRDEEGGGVEEREAEKHLVYVEPKAHYAQDT